MLYRCAAITCTFVVPGTHAIRTKLAVSYRCCRPMLRNRPLAAAAAVLPCSSTHHAGVMCTSRLVYATKLTATAAAVFCLYTKLTVAAAFAILCYETG